MYENHTKTQLVETISLQLGKINIMQDLLEAIRRENEHLLNENKKWKDEIKKLKQKGKTT